MASVTSSDTGRRSAEEEEVCNFWVGAQPDPNDRLRPKVSSADLQKIRELPAGLTFGEEV